MTTRKRSFVRKVGFMDSSSCLEYTNLDQKTTRQIKRMEVRKIKILKQDKQKIFTPQTRISRLSIKPWFLIDVFKLIVNLETCFTRCRSYTCLLTLFLCWISHFIVKHKGMSSNKVIVNTSFQRLLYLNFVESFVAVTFFMHNSVITTIDIFGSLSNFRRCIHSICFR